jgi:epoxyqueuosine reductase QueG
MNLASDIERVIKEVTMKANRLDLFRNPLVGYSSPDDPLFNRVKEVTSFCHLKPKDLFAEAKTVVSFFIPFSRKVIEANREAAEVAEEWAICYLASNQLCADIETELIACLSAKRIKAAAVPTHHDYNPETVQGDWSHKSAAYIAGLGRFGLNRMLITPAGSAGKLGTLFISETVPAGRPIASELHPDLMCDDCGYCVRNCPVKALDSNGFDRHKCNGWLLRVSEKFTYLGFCDICGKCNVGPCAIKESLVK